MDTTQFLQAAKRLIPQIEDALTQCAAFPQATPLNAEAMRYSLLAPGKRVRPLMALLATEACGGNTDAALPVACAIEMVHAYSLIHDDLPAMDDDELRRGKPTNHKIYGEGQAILAGDGLLTAAFQILAQQMPVAHAAACTATLATAAGPDGMVGGQSDDLQTEGKKLSINALEHIHKRKTGALLCAALRMGAIVADATDEQKGNLERYGRNLGLAFQITDDLLDADKEEEPSSYPALLGIPESKKRAALLIVDAQRALDSFGDRAATLQSLAQYVLTRDH